MCEKIINQPDFKGGVIINVDIDSVTSPFLAEAITEENFSRETLYPFIDQYADTQVKALSLNTFAQSSATPSKVWTDLLTIHDWKEENGIPVDYSDQYVGLYTCHKKFGVDPYRVWFERTRERGMEAWMSLRMNDCHEPRPKTFCGRSEFFYEAKKNGWMVGILPGHGLHYHHCLDYAVPEVRKMMLDYIEEQVNEYNIDAIELDFSRESICFKYTKCPEKCEIMTDFIRKIREITNKASKKHGHKVKIAVRLFRDIDQCKAFGFDAETWDKEGLVDHITSTSRWWSCDNDIPIDVWKKRCPNTEIGGGIEVHYRQPFNKTDISRPGKHNVSITADIGNGMAAAFVSEGADIINIYNNFINPYENVNGHWERKTHSMIRRLGDAETIYSTRRRHIIMFQEQEIVPYGFEAYHPLPLEISRGHNDELSLPIGYVPEGKRASLVIGFSYGDPSSIEIAVNGKVCSSLSKCDVKTLAHYAGLFDNPMVGNDTTLYIGEIDAESLMRYTLSINAIDDVVIEYVEVNIE
ncbi:MAG: hypothetical protein E7672_07925 [Ruminococcaceae bacterium]|nr:hypothetical protein [Oscillospiraceae bacterium]